MWFIVDIDVKHNYFHEKYTRKTFFDVISREDNCVVESKNYQYILLLHVLVLSLHIIEHGYDPYTCSYNVLPCKMFHVLRWPYSLQCIDEAQHSELPFIGAGRRDICEDSDSSALRRLDGKHAQYPSDLFRYDLLIQ